MIRIQDLMNTHIFRDFTFDGGGGGGYANITQMIMNTGRSTNAK